jgi:ribosomal-protein-alanine acetyltransferase
VIVIRAAAISDLDAVSSLERAVFSLAAWSLRSVEEELRAVSPDREVLVALEGHDLVGYAVLTRAGDTSDLRRIAVAEEYQRRRIATRLMVALLSSPPAGECDRVMLEVAAENTAALALYERSGFVETARRERYYHDGADAVVMELRTRGAQDG